MSIFELPPDALAVGFGIVLLLMMGAAIMSLSTIFVFMEWGFLAGILVIAAWALFCRIFGGTILFHWIMLFVEDEE